MVTLRFFIFSTLFIFSFSSEYVNNQPIIGILSTPSDYPDVRRAPEWSYFQSFYVELLETSGAQVVPIPFDLPPENLTDIFHKINGLLLPGASAQLWTSDSTDANRYFTHVVNSSKHLIDLAVNANLKGDYFPIWGTCQGLEIMAMVMTNDPFILDSYHQHDTFGNVTVLPEERKHEVFNDFTPELFDMLETGDLVWLWHEYGLNPQDFYKSEVLSEHFEIVVLANDTNNKTFVAQFKGKKLPFYLSQFHPEKPAFDMMGSPTIPHSPEALVIAQNYGNYFVNQARKNFHRFEKKDELEKILIKNFLTIKVPSTGADTYFVNKYSLASYNSGLGGKHDSTIVCVDEYVLLNNEL